MFRKSLLGFFLAILFFPLSLWPQTKVIGIGGVLAAAVENSINTSSVDANGNPNFLAAGAGLNLNINGGTTTLVVYIGDSRYVLPANVSILLTATSNQFVWVNANDTGAFTAADFGASALPPDYDYVAPGAPATDQHWFDLSTNQMYRYSGAAWVAVNRIFLGVARTSGAAIDGVVCEPYRLSPQKRFELFGDASDGILTVTGATNISASKQYSFVCIDGAALSHVAILVSQLGVFIRSQNPILIINAGSVNVNGKGSTGRPGTTGAGGNWGDNTGPLGGTGAGGGGSNINAGGAGAGHQDIVRTGFSSGGGTAGAINTAGGTGQASAAPNYKGFSVSGSGFGPSNGIGGGSGGGDGINNGGDAGSAAGNAVLIAPSVLIAAGCSVTANGGNGTAGVAGNAGGGGGGGGGTAIVAGGFVNNLGTISATGGTGGGGVGTGGAGGNGGPGTALAVRLW